MKLSVLRQELKDRATALELARERERAAFLASTDKQGFVEDALADARSAASFILKPTAELLGDPSCTRFHAIKLAAAASRLNDVLAVAEEARLGKPQQ